MNTGTSPLLKSWRNHFVSAVYATHNSSRQIRSTLDECLTLLHPGARGLVVGCGSTNLHPALINLDLVSGTNVHVIASAEHLPFPDGIFDLVLSQEVLEHVRDPFKAMREMKRVLKSSGIIYCQVPFTIGYHPGPTDFWRFTKEGILQIIQQAGLSCRELKIAVGPGTGFYRIVVEFTAILSARLCRKLYKPVKGLSALFFYPLKWLDPLLTGSPQADRIPGGYLVIASPKNPDQSFAEGKQFREV
jgi:SAM-dependent methyltransferase